MKLLTLNFLSCAVKTCKTSPLSFPLHPKDAELAKDDVEPNPDLLTNILPRLDWSALRTTAAELGFPDLPETAPSPEELVEGGKTVQDLHELLMETQIVEGKLVCGCCGHEYAVREGIANFLLPSHLV
ncbi:hypothetical protein B0T18DRAFT_386398 [Schizothecium vesticola]|uniref:Multifunctional methyltransferase subunit trm112 n=1 Tax=Schizothecium vesticola TaxID=314040 RepID=A0AA40FC01_9PEZI|nr:hypothetical protein B0T18DRAFT_386398 [Schizothecium vesticola]